MKFKVLDWQQEPVTGADARTFRYKLQRDDDPDNLKFAKVSFTGSLITTPLDAVTGEYNTEEWSNQMSRLGIALLHQHLTINHGFAEKPEYVLGYFTENYPYGSVYIPKINSAENYEFEI